MHPLQDGIRAGLQTQVELRAEIGVDAERLAEVLVDGARLQRAQADPDRGDRRAERRQQLPQAAAVLPLPAPGGDLDAVDDDLAVALGGKALRLLHRGLQRHGAHPAAGIGDDAVGAEIVAPVLDLQQRPRPRGKPARGQDLKRARLARVVHALPFLARGGSFDHVADEGLAAVGADEHVDVQLADLVRAALGVAAAHADGGGRIQLAHAPDGVAGFLVGNGCDGAGIDDIAVADLVKAAEGMPALHQQLLHRLRLVLVDLAAQRVTCKFHR